MAAPGDAAEVLATVRLGWYLAEVRGRNRPGAHPGAQLKLPTRTGHALPLKLERTAPELRKEAEEVLSALSADLGVDTDKTKSLPAKFPAELEIVAERLAEAEEPSAAQSLAGPDGGSGTVTGAMDGAGQSPGGPDGGSGTVTGAMDGAGQSPGGPDGGSGTVDGAGQSLAGPDGGSGMVTGAVDGAVDGAGQRPAPPAQDPGTVAGDWDALGELIYKFDAHIQDALATKSETVACGYQLGRALAECYWALDPSLPDNPETWASWSFLLGSQRSGEIGRLLGRLSAYFHPYTAAAIAGSVKVWGTVATTPDWRQEANTYSSLYLQIRRWYELVLLRQDPTTLLKPYQLLKDFRLVWRAIRLFRGQIVAALLSIGVLAVFAYLLSRPGISSLATSLLGALGITGFSVAGLTAKLKNDAQAMLKRVKQDAYTDLIAIAITTAPLPPKTVKVPRTGLIPPLTKKGKMVSIMRQRSITPITPD